MHSPGMRYEKLRARRQGRQPLICTWATDSFCHVSSLDTCSPSSQAHLPLPACVTCINDCCYISRDHKRPRNSKSFSCTDDLWLIKGLQMTLLLASSLSRDGTRFFYWTHRWAPWKVWSAPVLLKRTKNNKVFTVTQIKLKRGQLRKMCHIY